MIVRVMRANGKWSVETDNNMLDPRLRVLQDEDESLDALYARLSTNVPKLLGDDAAATHLQVVAFDCPSDL